MDPQNFVTLELGTLFHGRHRVQVLGERVHQQLARDVKAVTVQIRVSAACLEKGDASGLDLLARAARGL